MPTSSLDVFVRRCCSTPFGIIRVLKDRLGYFARPEGREEPFRARVFAEPALQRTGSYRLSRSAKKSLSVQRRLLPCAKPLPPSSPFARWLSP